MKVTVVGAGVIGLTCALKLAERGHEVRMVGAEPPERTTSSAAGAVFGLYRIESGERATRWGGHSLRVFERLARGGSTTGVRMRPGVETSRTEAGPPAWLRTLVPWQPVTDGLSPGIRAGWRYVVPLIDMQLYLDFLVQCLGRRGVRFEKGEFDSLSAVGGDGPMINCTGSGAGALAGDDQVQVVRGQQVVLENPGIDEFFMEDVGHSADLIGIYPHGTVVVLGGTAEPGRRDRTADATTATAIIERAARVHPELAGARVIRHLVGLRPVRPAVRIEIERLRSGRWCVHNYGHGGAGVSVAWGCAADVADLVARLGAAPTARWSDPFS